MRQRSLNRVFDKILWGGLMLLPLILLLVFACNPRVSSVDRVGSSDFTYVEEYTYNSPVLINQVWESLALSDISGLTFDDWCASNVLYKTFNKIFGYDGEFGILSLCAGGFIPFFATWIINVSLLHIFTDFILMLPRITKKFMDRVGLEE